MSEPESQGKPDYAGAAKRLRGERPVSDEVADRAAELLERIAGAKAAHAEKAKEKSANDLMRE